MGIGSILKNGGAIIRPQMVGGDQFHIGKDLNGDFIFSINQTSMKMSPAQTQDLAIRLLQALGATIGELQGAPQPGPKLAG